MTETSASLGITHRELDLLLEQYRIGAMLPGSDEHEAFVVSAIEYMPRLVEIARQVVPGETLATVEIPGFLPRGSQNVREHHMVRARRVRAERARVGTYLAKFARDLRNKGALVGRVAMTRNTTRLADSDNCVASMKGVRDAVAAWLGVDDGDPGISWTTGQQKVKRAGVGVVIRIEGKR